MFILQELLFVGIRNCVLRIDTTKVGRGRDFNAEEPIKCHLDELIDGVRLVGRHDGDVTDLSISQWMTTRLASGSNDGTVCIKYFPIYCEILNSAELGEVFSEWYS